MVHRFVKENGLSATIYTQTTDCETETNGLMTYDRKINKMGVENVYNATHDIIPPSLTSPERIFTDSYNVELKNYKEGGQIFFTIDGSNPTEKSKQYSAPFDITATTTIKAYTKWGKDAQSRVITYFIEKKSVMPAITETGTYKSGLKAQIYEGKFSNLPDFSTLKPVTTKIASVVSPAVAGRDSLFSVTFDGYILIPADGVYGLYISSDDGSKMTIDGTEPILNDGIHGIREEGKSFPLAKGYHKLRIEYFQNVGGIGLDFLVEAPGEKKITVPATWLFN
jgi:hypothetical protein